VHDTWDPLGLRGTGSHDFSVRGSRVPDGHVLDFGRMAPTCDAPISRVPTFVLFSAGIAAVVLGIATGAQEALVALATQKRPVQSSRTLGEFAVAQDDMARNDTALRAARAHLIETSGAVWEAVRDGSRVSTEARLAVRLAATHATEVCVGVVSRCVALAGGSAVPSRSPFAVALRDISTAAAHVMVSARAFETGGRFQLGFPIDPATF
jgi:alkylation response protein AidB-like acyl-CoA dehydrogenase